MALIDEIKEQISEIGRAGLNALFPNDFEYYVVTLELTDSRGRTIDYLTFPVSPSMISYDDLKITSIKKSFGGVTSLDTESFVPKKIALSGMFGRKLRLLVGPSSKNAESTDKGIFDVSKQNGLSVNAKNLSIKLKTGYGSTKILEAIHAKSSGLDQYNRPNRLYLYIPPLGHSFLVKSNALQLSQDYSSSNMMWKYNLTLTTLSKVEDLVENDQSNTLLKSTGFDSLQKGTNALAGSIKNSIF